MSPAELPNNAELVAQMRPALVNYFRRRCGSDPEAEDLAQDVIMRALAHSNWTSLEQAKGYVFRAAVNRWRDRRRRSSVRGTSLEFNEEVALGDEEISLERVLSGRQALQRVADVLMELSERTRDVFVLIRLEQMKQAEVAALLGVSISSVEKHLAKALAHLARRAAVEDWRP